MNFCLLKVLLTKDKADKNHLAKLKVEGILIQMEKVQIEGRAELIQKNTIQTINKIYMIRSLCKN